MKMSFDQTLVTWATLDEAAPGRIPRALHHVPIGEWLRGLGLEDVRALVILQTDDGHYYLHVSQMVRNDTGSIVMDRALDRIATRPRILDLGTEPTWPDCLNESRYRQHGLMADSRQHVAVG